MPVLPSAYIPPPLLGGGHTQTIFPTLFRTVRGVLYRRERVATPDGDFLDLDWAGAGTAGRLAILCHGLEGDTQRSYMLGMARALLRDGWDVLAWNYRGCGGEPNWLLRSYHSGATEDLDTVVRHVVAAGTHQRIALVGFSLGGNLVLKYVGERGGAIDPRIAATVAFSAPCDLRASADRLAMPDARIYMRRFIVSLAAKIREKAARFPGQVDTAALATVRTFHQFDDLYTAPLHGFAGAEDYWARASSCFLLGDIRVPTLMVSARNDPFLAGGCYPREQAEANPMLCLEMPRSGGHLGFVAFGDAGRYWSERRAVEFLSQTA
jgi:predicted alpha/beta-fold hydrolase